ncbi:hypothetical protein MN608_00188 [Microdochium nivale]|nr:hypothetical protein MN608_00188 [Microdochium nivale]
MLELILPALQGIFIGALEGLLWCAVFGSLFTPHWIEYIDSRLQDRPDKFYYARLAPGSKRLMPVDSDGRPDAQAHKPAGFVASVSSRARTSIWALDNRINWLKALIIMTPSRKRLVLVICAAVLVALPCADYWVLREELRLARRVLDFDRTWLEPLGITVSDMIAYRVRLGLISAFGTILVFSAYWLLRTTVLQAFWVCTLWTYEPGTMFVVKYRQTKVEAEAVEAHDEESAVAGK